LPHAVGLCDVQGACVLVSCSGGYLDCDGHSANGCEASPDSPSSCGTCGVICDHACESHKGGYRCSGRGGD
jgi:hypothetical protein